jgi:hypothetical protein
MHTMNSITPTEAKRLMVEAIGTRLFFLSERNEYLSAESLVALKSFATGSGRSIRLIVNMSDRSNESMRCVTLALVQRKHDAGLTWRVKVETSVWSSNPEGSDGAMRGWGIANGLAVVALRVADSMPPIEEHITEHV